MSILINEPYSQKDVSHLTTVYTNTLKHAMNVFSINENQLVNKRWNSILKDYNQNNNQHCYQNYTKMVIKIEEFGQKTSDKNLYQEWSVICSKTILFQLRIIP